MRIALVNWTARRAGGVETYLGLLIPALRGRGHEVFFCHELHEPESRSLIDGVTAGPSSQIGATGLSDSVRELAAWQPDVLFVHRLERPEHELVLTAIAPSVFFAHGYYGTCISGSKATCVPTPRPCNRIFGPMCLVNYFPRRCGGLSPVTMLAEYKRQSTRLELLRQYQAIVTFSEHMRREYLNHGFRDDRVIRLPAVDPMDHTIPTMETADGPSAAMIRESATERPSRLAFIGRVDRLKGCGLFLSALPTIRASTRSGIAVTVAGDGPDLERCRQLAASITATLPDVEITFLGWTSTERCHALLEQTDVLAMPSLWPEPFGLVGIEAQRRGVPVAAFAVGGIPEWLEDGTSGALAPADPPTIAGMAAAITRCLTSPDIRRAARAGAHQAHADYSIDRHIDALIQVLISAADKTPPTVAENEVAVR